MTKSDDLPIDKDHVKKKTDTDDSLIPQIVLTEPANEEEQVESTTPKNSPIQPTPLPLTKDLLQRKNKLDRLLSQKEKKQQHDFYSIPNTFVDERVTAGLGISTPNNNHSGLRPRRTSSSPISNSNRSDPEKSIPFQPQQYEWNYDLDVYKTSASGVSSSKGKPHNQSGNDTSVSGSSNRNSVSMRAYSANHRYMDKYNTSDNRHHFERPLQPNQARDDDKASQYYLIDLLYQAVIRVVHARAPESKSMSTYRHQTTEQSVTKDIINVCLEKQDTIHTQANLNQRAAAIGSPYSNSKRSSKRFSWLSKATSTDDNNTKSSFEYIDNESVFNSKLTPHNSNHPPSIIPPPLPPLPRISSPVSPSIAFTDQSPLQGNSLYLFSPTNPIRIHLWRFIRKRYVSTFIFFIMILHWFLLACVPITSNQQKSVFGGQWNHYPILVIQCFYTLEILCKIIAYGFLFPPSKETKWKLPAFLSPTLNEEQSTPTTSATFVSEVPFNRRHKAYLNSFGNALDFISVVSYWADFILMMFEYPFLSLFKSLAALRPLRLLSILPGTAVILKSLETSWDILLAVCGLILFFLLLFALFGLISFKGVFSRRCYYIDTSNTLQLVEPALFCSGFRNGTNIVGAYNVETKRYSYPGYNGYICAAGQTCIEDPINNPQFGYVNYDTIFSSFLSVYTFVSLELWTDLMYQTQDADSTVAALYYCMGVYIIAFVLTFLLFAVITSAFARVRAVSAVSAFTAKKKGYPVLRDAEGLDDEAMWMFDNPPEDLGHGMTRIKLRWWIVRLVNSRTFFYFGGFLVLFDMVFMCLRSFNASEQTLEMVDNAETAFSFVFAIEIILRMVGATNWMTFWSTKRNLFDLFLVIVTCVIQLPVIQDSNVYKYLTIFQILRMYRLFICIPRVRRLLSAALGTGESVFYVMIFLVLATALCATIFMQMFGGDFDTLVEDTNPGNRFNTFWESFISLIVVYTSETWTAILYNAMASQTGQGSIYAAIALSVYFAFGRYIMSGLYIAVVLENFELSDDYIRHYQIKDFIHRHRFKDNDRTETILLKLFRPFYHINERKNVQISKLPANLTAPLTKDHLTELLTDLSKQNHMQEQTTTSWIERKMAVLISLIRQRIPFLQKKTSLKSAPINAFMQDADNEPDDFDAITAEENREAQKESTPVVHSLFIFSNRSRIRYWCKKLVGSNSNGQAERHNMFNWLVMACVFVSILMVILDEPSTRLIRKDTVKQDTFNTIEISLSVAFLVELAIRVIADGLLLTPNAYLRNYWNQLDACVILLNTVTIFMGTEEVPRGLSTFRSLRILRLIRYFNGVRDIFVALFYSFPLMLDALIFTFLVLIPFAIYGVNIFGGLMWICNDDSVSTRGECVGEFYSSISGDDGSDVSMWVPRVWQNPENGFYSYDNFPIALQHLFSITSTEGWVDSMFTAMSTPPQHDIQPHFNWHSHTAYHALFYLVFMIISQGTIQLFVGVIIEKFKERNGITTLTTAQRQYCDLQRLLANVNPTIKVFRPQSRIRQICYDMIIEKHGKFNRLMMCIIGINIIAIASEFHSEPAWLESLQNYSYFAFTVIYVIECIIKLLGLGWKKWIRSKWNWYDGLIAGSALILLILRFALPDLWTVRVERYCLVMAAFRLGEGIDALQTLYHTIAKSLPSIIQVSAVFMVAMCLFAMLFMEFFGLTKYGIYGTEHVNFRDYGNALLLLVRATTGEAWNAIIIDYTVQYPNCNSSSNYLQDDCGSPFWSYFLFDVFYIVCTHIFMNLFTAVIISNFEYAYETRTRFTNITKADLRMFKHAWAEIDTNGAGYIQKEDVTKFLRSLTGQFQLRIYDDIHSVSNLLRCSRQPIKTDITDEKYYSSVHPSPMSPSGNSPYSRLGLDTGEINVREINRCLNKMDVEKIRKRRLEYNLYVKEILRTETPKGIPFASVLTIISYRFINISTSLTLDPLIARLEKIDQLTQEYHLEKAAGFFLSQVQKKRFIHKLWEKRDEDEVKKLGLTNTSHFKFGSPQSPSDSPLNYLDTPKPKKTKKSSPPVPRIVIDNVPAVSEQSSPTTTPGTGSFPVSPMSHFSMDHHDASFSGGARSLSVAPGTASIPSSPNTDFENVFRFGSGALSPYSPLPTGMSPASRQNWLLIDSNMDMSNDISDGLIDAMNHNVWSDMLRDENS